MRFEFPCNLEIVISIAPIMTRIQILVHGWDQNKDIGAIAQTDLTRSLFPFMSWARRMIKETFDKDLLTFLFQST